MIKRLLLILAVLAILMPAGVVLASDTSTALYRATITVTNNSTAATNVATTFTGNTSAWMDVGYVNSTANDTAMLSAAAADLPYMPGYNNPWCVWVPSIGEDSYINDYLYMGGEDDMDGKIRYFPTSGGMTTEDSGGEIGLSDNWTYEASGFTDTTAGASKYIVEKDDALEVYVSPSVSGNITAAIIVGDGSDQLAPDGVGNETNIPTVFPGATPHWQTQLTNDGATSYVQTDTAGYARDLYSCGNSTISGSISDVSVYIVVRDVADNTGRCKTAIRTHSTTYDGSEKNPTGAFATYSTSYSTNPNTSGTWSWNEVNDMEIGVSLKDPGNATQCTQVYAIVTYDPTIPVSATGIDSGEHTVKVWADGTDFGIIVDEGEAGEVSDNTTFAGSVPDNGNDIVSFQNGVMPYVEYQEITVNGVQKQYVDWEYGATFTDSSGNGNDATPTFRTTSSDADVSAELVAFAPVSTADAPAYSVADAPFFYTGNITASGNFISGEVPATGPPGSEVVEEAAEAGGTPNIWLWGWIAIASIAVCGLGISYMEKKFGSGGGTLIARVVVAVVVFGLLIAFSKFDWWMLVLYGIIVSAIIMWSQHREWGGSVSQHGLIGFLASTWIGLTLINRIMESQFLTLYERTWANNFAFTQEFKAFDVFSIPVLNFSFFTEGIPSLMRWDYSFFGGNAQLFQYLLYSLTAVMSFIIFGILIGLLYNAFRAR